MKTYQYEPLPKGAPTIRLLILQPGQWNAPICCQLQDKALDEQPGYEALSYVWGEPKDLLSIHIHGLPHQIQPNLEIALRHLRREDVPRVLWVDALCINQDDLDERRDQVQLMYLIYQQASLVVSWLGESSVDSGEGIRLLHALGHWTIEHKDAIFGKKAEKTNSFKDQHLVPYMARTGFDLEGHSWQALVRLLWRDYWTRVWILQELAAGGFSTQRRGIIVCGKDEVDRRFYDYTCVILPLILGQVDMYDTENEYREPLKSILVHGRPPGLSMMQSLAASVGRRREHNFEYLMRMSRPFKATDPRDKIYALLGLAREEDRSILPDYSKSVNIMLQDLVKSRVKKSGTLQILQGNRFQLDPSVPSWTPDLSSQVHGEGAYIETGNPWRPSGPLSLSVEFHGTKLITHGITVGNVAEVIGPWRLGEPVPMGVSHSREALHALGRDAIFSQFIAVAEKLKGPRAESFWRTLVMDRDASRLADTAIYPAQADLGWQQRVLFGQDSLPKDFMPGYPPDFRILTSTKNFQHNMMVSLGNRCFFTTDSGHLGVGPYAISPRDVVAIFPGSKTCFIVREIGQCYKLIGDAEPSAIGSAKQDHYFPSRSSFALEIDRPLDTLQAFAGDQRLRGRNHKPGFKGPWHELNLHGFADVGIHDHRGVGLFQRHAFALGESIEHRDDKLGPLRLFNHFNRWSP